MPFQVAPFQQAIGQVSAPSRPGFLIRLNVKFSL